MSYLDHVNHLIMIYIGKFPRLGTKYSTPEIDTSKVIVDFVSGVFQRT